MRHPRTRRRWQHVFGLALILALGVAPLAHPMGVFADAGTDQTPVVVVSPTPTTAPIQYRMTLADLNLRTAPDAAADVITVVPQNTTVIFLGQTNGIYAQIKYNDATGWVVAEYLLEDVSGAGAETPTPGATTTATATATAGSTETPGTTVVPTGTTAPTEPATSTPETVTPTETPVVTETPAITETVVTDPERVLLESVNLRAEPNANAEIVTVLDKGITVRVTGRTSGLYSEITAGSSTGWAATQYLGTPGAITPTTTTTVEPTSTGTATTVTPSPTTTTAPTTPATTVTPTAGPTQAPTIPAGDSLIIWPVKGGTWEITQGYHGSSHQNESSLWQYANSFDIVRDDAETAGQPVYSPVNGTIRWFDPSTGGISIDMGNGYAFALFHMDVDPSLVVGQTLTQGQYIGSIAQPGGGGNGGFPHLHLTVWATDDGGNWSRTAVPFVGQLAISGAEFPDTGASYEHTGYTFNP